MDKRGDASGPTAWELGRGGTGAARGVSAGSGGGAGAGGAASGGTNAAGGTGVGGTSFGGVGRRPLKVTKALAKAQGPYPETADPAEVHPERYQAAAGYQRMRLWCGVLGIGAILAVLWGVLWLGGAGAVTARMGHWPAMAQGAVVMALLAVLVSVVQFPFDVFAGRVVEGNYRQTDLVADFSWGTQYVVNVLLWCGKLVAAGAVAGWVVSAAPEKWAVWAGLALFGLGLLQWVVPVSPGPGVELGSVRKAWLEQVRAELVARKLRLPRMVFYEHGERSLAGGWSGAGFLRGLYVARTLFDIEPVIAAGLVVRELAHLREGHRLLSLMCTALWTVLGVMLASVVARAGGYAGSPGAVVLVIAVVMTTWCWLGLLCVWPPLGRYLVFAADRAMLEAGYTVEECLRVLATLSERNRPDEDLPPVVAFVFHPIPPMRARRAALIRAAAAKDGSTREETKG